MSYRALGLNPRITYGLGILVSVVVLVASLMEWLPKELGSTAEVLGVVTGVWCVWLLARNNPLGWWIGLVMVVAYMVVFYRVRLFAEVGIQVFYFVTSLQAIWIWLRGGKENSERPISSVPRRWLWLTSVPVIVAVIGLHGLLVHFRGAAPFWDSLTTVLSITAHLYLMWRFVESWYLWITVDLIYIPLYASRGLYLTSVLYVGLLILATRGLFHFRRRYREASS